MPGDKETIEQFAARIKAKYPDYKDIPDTDLVNKIIAKHPEYKEKVDFGVVTRNPTSQTPEPKFQGNVDFSNTLALATPNYQNELDTKHQFEVAGAQTRLDKELQNSDPAIKSLLTKYKQQGQMAQIQDQLHSRGLDAGGGKIDLSRVQNLIPKASIQVGAEEIKQYRDAMQQDPNLAREALYESAQLNPDKAKQIAADTYLLDSKDRAKGNNTGQILKNKEGIEKGENDYSIWHGGQVKKPEGLIQSLGRGFHERTQQFKDYDFLNKAKDEDIIHEYEKRRSTPKNEDEPVPVAHGISGGFGQMMGSEGPTLAKGALPAVLDVATGGSATPAVPWLSALLTSPDFYERGYANAFNQHYNELRDQGHAPEYALKIAKNRATFDASTDVAVGAAMSATGAKMAPAGVTGKFTPGFIGAVKGAVKEMAASSPEAASVGALGGLAQAAKNVHSGKSAGEGVAEAALTPIAFHFGIKSISAGAKIVGGTLFKSSVENMAKQPEESVNKSIGEQVESGELTPEKATEVYNQINEKRQQNAALIDKAKEVVSKGTIKGVEGEPLQADINDPEKFDAHLKHISDQAHDPKTAEKVEETYGKDLVDVAKQLHPAEDVPALIDANRKFDLKEVDDEIKKLSSESTDYGKKKEALQKQKDQINDYYDNYGKHHEEINAPQIENNEAQAETNQADEVKTKGTGSNEPVPFSNQQVEAAKGFFQQGIENGTIDKEYAEFAQHPDHLLGYIKDEVKAGKGDEMEKEFGKDLVTLSQQETHYPIVRNVKTKERNIVSRTEEEGVEKSKIDKPHGIYTTPIEHSNPHESLGGETHHWELNPRANVLHIDEAKNGDVVVRKGAINASAGVHAVKVLLGGNKFNELRSKTKEELLKYAKNEYKNIDFDRYYDKQDILEAIGALEAKKKGYDAIRLEDKKNPSFSEHVLLTENAGKSIKLKNNATTEQIAGAMDVGQQSADGEEMGSGNAQPEGAPGESQPQAEGQNQGQEEKLDPYGLPFENQPEDKRTGIKNAISYATRFEQKLPKVEVPKLGSDSEVLQQGKELVDNGTINPHQVIDRILSTNEGMHPDEAKAMQYYMHQLGAHEEVLRQQFADAPDDLAKAYTNGQLQQLSDEIDAATEANIKSGKAWSDVGNIRQIVVDPAFNASREKSLIKEAYGGKLPPGVQEKIDAALKQRDAAIEARLKAEERLKNAAASKTVEKIKQIVEKEEKAPKSKKQTKEDILKEREGLIEELKKAWKEDRSQLGAFPLPAQTVAAIGKLAINYFKEGYVNLEELTEKIFEDVKAHLPGIGKKDVRDAISQYDPLRVVAKGTSQKKLEVKEQKINKQLATGKIIPPKNNPSLHFEKDTAWQQAKQKAINAEYKLKVEKRKAFESKKNMYQKGLMWVGRGVRLSVLSGYNVLGKLASAATIGGAIKRIPEQAIGSIYSQVFKGISQKAPIEGSPNLSAELKFYSEFFNPKKFAKNSLEILKSGSSPLSKQFGGAEHEHIPVLYLPTDLHQIIKDPLKRGTFEASFKNAMSWAEKQGLDITDPLVIQSMETASYKRAQYEIFQEQNWLSKKFSEFKTNMEKKGNIGATGKFLADFMIPVSTVPTNIVRRLTTTSPLGLIRGSAQVIEAYRKGIENLSNEQADAVMKQLKQGSLGTALWLVGWFGASQFGGLYSKYNPDKKRQEGELVSDEMSIGGKMIPKPVQHALPLEVIQLAATMRHIHDNYVDRKGASQPEADYNAALGSIGALAEQIPVIETGAHLMGAFNNPYEAAKLKEDVTRRFEPQILRETGIIKKTEKKPSTSGWKAGKRNHKR